MDVDPSRILELPVIQYGFAGMALILLAMVFWMYKRLLTLLEKTMQVIGENTATMRAMREDLKGQGETLDDLYCKMLARPCIAKEE